MFFDMRLKLFQNMTTVLLKSINFDDDNILANVLVDFQFEKLHNVCL